MPSSPDFDLYEALKITKDASADEIIASYRRLARLHHPDKNLDNADATAEFQKVQAAYEVLSDEHQRRVYDESVSSSRLGGGSSQRHHQAYHGYEGGEMDKMVFDIFLRHVFARGPIYFTDMEQRPREDRRREEEEAAQVREQEAAQEAARFEKFHREIVEQAKRETEAELKKTMEEADAAALKEEAETKSKMKMDNIFAAHACITDVEKQAYCEHCSFWPKEQMKRKFRCLNCGRKRGMTRYKCPYCALVICQHCLVTKKFRKTT
ncbi:hypothetical protein DSL72_008190 [Monilinia vaccinii-corymbosi]|uniref:J domain-containing protein n=1 Tax=Monilinia vaccinii-corymbosi TaxID=61207 RepID=A0A8A3PK42_9HELO|nr:hypothetical protein DSL72_008190 [Monilinia vaccinii-corymbosi]